MCSLGTPADVSLFFDCIDSYVVPAYPRMNWSLLTDRLYRRYLRLEELDAAALLMKEVEKIFMSLPSTVVGWSDLENDPAQTRLNSSLPMLADVFAKYFEHFFHCVSSAKLFFKSWNIYKPVKVATTDVPNFVIDEQRPLEEYDQLEGKPFWLR